jgi:predicted nuclease of restriction endonuclease-like (RecB) superfamily
MRRFYVSYKDYEKLQQLVAEIPWGQNLVIMSRVKDYREREFYIRKTLEYGWTRDVLVHQIEAEAHLEIDAKKKGQAKKLPVPFLFYILYIYVFYFEI